MINPDTKQNLINEFSDFLENLTETTTDNLTHGDTTLFNLCEAFIGLKAMVKQESHQVKNAITSLEKTTQELAVSISEHKNKQHSGLKPLT